MKDYEFLAKYADLPLPERSNIISAALLGYSITWNDLHKEVMLQVTESKKSALFEKFNKYQLYKLMSNYTDPYWKKEYIEGKTHISIPAIPAHLHSTGYYSKDCPACIKENNDY